LQEVREKTANNFQGSLLQHIQQYGVLKLQKKTATKCGRK